LRPARCITCCCCHRRHPASPGSSEMGGHALIVSAADDTYFPLLADLVLSIRRNPHSAGTAIAVLDLGLAETARRWLEEQLVTLAVPGWDLDFPGRDRTPSI